MSRKINKNFTVDADLHREHLQITADNVESIKELASANQQFADEIMTINKKVVNIIERLIDFTSAEIRSIYILIFVLFNIALFRDELLSLIKWIINNIFSFCSYMYYLYHGSSDGEKLNIIIMVILPIFTFILGLVINKLRAKNSKS